MPALLESGPNRGKGLSWCSDAIGGAVVGARGRTNGHEVSAGRYRPLRTHLSAEHPADLGTLRRGSLSPAVERTNAKPSRDHLSAPRLDPRRFRAPRYPQVSLRLLDPAGRLRFTLLFPHLSIAFRRSLASRTSIVEPIGTDWNRFPANRGLQTYTSRTPSAATGTVVVRLPRAQGTKDRNAREPRLAPSLRRERRRRRMTRAGTPSTNEPRSINKRCHRVCADNAMPRWTRGERQGPPSCLCLFVPVLALSTRRVSTIQTAPHPPTSLSHAHALQRRIGVLIGSCVLIVTLPYCD